VIHTEAFVAYELNGAESDAARQRGLMLSADEVVELALDCVA